VIALATTTISIIGGSATYDGWGDVVEGSTVSASGIPASILEQTRLVTRPADNRAQVVRYYTGRVPAGTEVTTSNRILDERTGQLYVIDSVATVASPVITNDVRLDLRRATT
jgi:hypothetical protein